MSAPRSIVIEFPKMNDLIDCSSITLKVTDQALVMSALLEGWEAQRLLEFYSFAHFSDTKRVGSELVECHEHSLRFVQRNFLA